MKNCKNAILSTTNHKWIDLASKLCFGFERSATNRLNHKMNLKKEINLNHI